MFFAPFSKVGILNDIAHDSIILVLVVSHSSLSLSLLPLVSLTRTGRPRTHPQGKTSTPGRVETSESLPDEPCCLEILLFSTCFIIFDFTHHPAVAQRTYNRVKAAALAHRSPY